MVSLPSTVIGESHPEGEQMALEACMKVEEAEGHSYGERTVSRSGTKGGGNVSAPQEPTYHRRVI